MAKKRVLAVLDNLPREVILRQMFIEAGSPSDWMFGAEELDNVIIAAKREVPGDLFPCTHHRVTKKCLRCSHEEPAMLTPARSAMVEKVQEALANCGYSTSEYATEEAIAAMLDNLPRDAIDVFVSTYASFQGKGRYKEARAALKREVLGHE